MARHLFGGIADYVVIPGDAVTVGDVDGFQTVLAPSLEVTFYNAVASGTQYTDLLDLSLTPISAATTTADGALPQFWGPDGVTLMYADAGGARRAISAVDVGSVVADVDALQNAVEALQALAAMSVLSVVYDEVTAEWPVRPAIAAGRIVYWHGPNSTPPPAGYMQTNDEFHGWTG